MAESGPGDRKTEYFSTFLDVLARGGSRGAMTLGTPGRVDLKDTLIRTLKKSGGEASLRDLIEPPFSSIGLLMDVLLELRDFGLIELQNGQVRLTADGDSVAEKLGPELTAGPGAAAN
jgi:hypothetical protein